MYAAGAVLSDTGSLRINKVDAVLNRIAQRRKEEIQKARSKSASQNALFDMFDGQDEESTHDEADTRKIMEKFEKYKIPDTKAQGENHETHLGPGMEHEELYRYLGPGKTRPPQT